MTIKNRTLPMLLLSSLCVMLNSHGTYTMLSITGRKIVSCLIKNNTAKTIKRYNIYKGTTKRESKNANHNKNNNNGHREKSFLEAGLKRLYLIAGSIITWELLRDPQKSPPEYRHTDLFGRAREGWQSAKRKTIYACGYINQTIYKLLKKDLQIEKTLKQGIKNNMESEEGQKNIATLITADTQKNTLNRNKTKTPGVTGNSVVESFSSMPATRPPKEFNGAYYNCHASNTIVAEVEGEIDPVILAELVEIADHNKKEEKNLKQLQNRAQLEIIKEADEQALEIADKNQDI